MTERTVFSGPDDYARYTPYVVLINGEVAKAFRTRRQAETFRESLPWYEYAEVKTRKSLTREASTGI